MCCDPMEPAPDLDNPILISALQHAVYCLRQAALIHIERVWSENRFTAEGRVLHHVAHEADSRKSRGVQAGTINSSEGTQIRTVLFAPTKILNDINDRFYNRMTKSLDFEF